MVGMLVRRISTQTDEVEASECFWMQSHLPFSQSANANFSPEPLRHPLLVDGRRTDQVMETGDSEGVSVLQLFPKEM